MELQRPDEVWSNMHFGVPWRPTVPSNHSACAIFTNFLFPFLTFSSTINVTFCQLWLEWINMIEQTLSEISFATWFGDVWTRAPYVLGGFAIFSELLQNDGWIVSKEQRCSYLVRVCQQVTNKCMFVCAKSKSNHFYNQQLDSMETGIITIRRIQFTSVLG